MVTTSIPNPLLLVISLVLLSYTPIHSRAALISSSKLELCTNSGESIPCEKKFVVAISIQGDQDGTESVSYLQKVTNKESEPKVLKNPITIKVKKSLPMTRYPLTYVQNFNSKPYETSIYTPPLKCKDGAGDAEPTCGRKFDGDKPIQYSEGYCCKCGFCELFGLCSSTSRANINCALLADGASATCLNFSPLWYSAYSIGPPETWYRITVTVSTEAHHTDGKPLTSSILLGPDQLGGKNDAFGVTAQLIGDFASFKSPTTFDTKYLFVPAVPIDDPRVTAEVPTEWMLIEKHQVTLDGSECNKIGVSYQASVSEGNKCALSRGSCTGAQIDDLRAADAEKAAQGITGNYMLKNYGEFMQVDQGGNPIGNNDHISSNIPYIAYRQKSAAATLVTLTFVADKMSYTVNVASGIISSYNLSTFGANTQDGKLEVKITNTGSISADFHLSITGCTKGTFPIMGQAKSLNSMEMKIFEFDVFSADTQGSDRNECNATLSDALFNKLNTIMIKWATNAQEYSTGSQGGKGGNKGGETNNVFGDDSSCSSCPFYNPICFIGKKCFWQVIVHVGVYLLIILCVVFLIRYRKCLMKCMNEKSSTKHRRHKARDSYGDTDSSDGEKMRERIRKQITARLDTCPTVRRSSIPYTSTADRNYGQPQYIEYEQQQRCIEWHHPYPDSIQGEETIYDDMHAEFGMYEQEQIPQPYPQHMYQHIRQDSISNSDVIDLRYNNNNPYGHNGRSSSIRSHRMTPVHGPYAQYNNGYGELSYQKAAEFGTPRRGHSHSSRNG
eukprot:Tbor_TRINITY_DN5967_c2_g2::TRINITY_DN5967_c2_g2_i9::g.19069::m.19069